MSHYVIKSQFLKILLVARFDTPKFGPVNQTTLQKQRGLVTCPDTPEVQPGPWDKREEITLVTLGFQKKSWELST